MSITTYSTTYFDDFNVKDINADNKTVAEKNYLRILFKPGYSVQVRELNQLQSILQSQIDRLGSSVYKDGSAVIGGNCTFDNNISVVDVSTTITNLDGVTIISSESNGNGLTANLLSYKSISANVLRLYVRYNNSTQDINTNANISVFTPETTLHTDSLDIPDLGICSINGYAAGAFLDEGVFYTKGSFVWTPKQSAFLDKPSANYEINKLIILGITEAVVNYSFDNTLKDNATGTPNYSAPGADRYTIDLSLDFIDDTDSSTLNYIRLLTIKTSQSLDTIKKIYTSLDDVLAKRTYEESGDYTLSPFKITLREFYNDGTNGGRYTESEMPAGSFDPDFTTDEKIAFAKTLYSLSLDPAVAYIKGYRVELTQARDLYSSKGRDPINNIVTSSSARVGNYVVGYFAGSSSLPTITNPRNIYELHAETLEYSGSPRVIGTCKIRAIDGPLDAIRLHLYDIVISNSLNLHLSDAVRIYSNLTVPFEFTITDPVTLIDSQYATNLFPIPYGTTQRVGYLSYTYNILATDGSHDGVTSTTFTIPSTHSTSVFADTSLLLCTTNTDEVVYRVGTKNGTTEVEIPGYIKSVILPILVSEPEFPEHLKSKIHKTIPETAQEILSSGLSTRMLLHGDIIKINSVYTESGIISGKDVTSLCSISDDGQRDNYYINSSIYYSGPVTDTLYISYDYYDHSTGDYFTVNSYPSNMLYDDIPSYNGIHLSDVYDFRPLILSGGPTVEYTPLDPDSVITSVINYYLPRVDTVLVDSNGIFSVISGDSALEPKAPIIPANSMALYTLNVPAYTYSPKDIKVNYIDNRRFTMRDIGGIEKRISNIEYYTSLSLLETSAQNASITDDQGLQRLKNGYIVDAFTGHSIGDPVNAGYACAVDTSVGLLRPKYTMNNLRLVAVPTSNVTFHTHVITMPYSEQVLINQSYASDTLSVNPYDVAVFSGNISLIPSTDNWKDILHSPDLIINDTGAYDAVALTASSSDTFGLHWNEWQTNWIGQSTTYGGIASMVAGGFGQSTRNVSAATISTSYQSRTGTITSLGYTDQTQSLGNRAIDISYIPYIRPRKIYFSGNKLKPNTRLYAFFDGIAVTDYCNQLTNTPATTDNSTDTAVYYDVTPADVTILLGEPLITDEFGDISGEFIIPNNDITRFKCGQRVFKLTDSPNNLASESTTLADTQYIASGTTETQQETILSIRKPELIVASISDTQSVFAGVNIQYSDPLAQTFLIPNVEEGLYSTGFDLFFSSKSDTLPVTAYIVLVSNGIPTQQIMPFSMVTVPASAVNADSTGVEATRFRFSDPVYLLNGTEYAIVVTSNSADYRIWVATVGGTDVISNTAITKNVYNGVLLMSQNASTWTPEQTKDMKFTLYYASFNTSANATVTFNKQLSGGITRIDYKIDDAGYLTTAPLVTIAPPGTPATSNIITRGINGNITNITVSGGTGYILPPLVTISKPASGGRQAKAHAIIAGGMVTEIKIDDEGLGYTNTVTVTIAPPGITATARAYVNPSTNTISEIVITNPGSGYVSESPPLVQVRKSDEINNWEGIWHSPSEGHVAAVIESIDVSLFNVNRNAVAVNKTMITDSLEIGSYPNISIIPNENYPLASSLNITNTSNPVILTSVLSSTSSYLSPVIDIERNSIICVNNIINDGTDEPNTETTEDADTTSARYITRTINLNNASDRIDIYVNVNRPTITSNIRVYVKYDNGSTWNLYNPDIQIPVSSNSNSFTEIHYTDLLSNTLFTSFAVKIVMISDNSAQVPTIKDFRAIATF